LQKQNITEHNRYNIDKKKRKVLQKKTQQRLFLPATVCNASSVLVIARASIRPSVTPCYPIKTAQARITKSSFFLYGLLCMAASGWIDIIHYTYIHTYKHTYKDNATIYTMQ